MKSILTKPSSRIYGATRQAPGSKSISNRILLLSSLTPTKTQLKDLLNSEDTNIMINATYAFGARVQRSQPEWSIHKLTLLTSKHSELFLGNSGTSARSLSAMLSCYQGNYFLYGLQRIHERPLQDMLFSLRTIGTNIKHLFRPSCLPLFIRPLATVKDSIRVLLDGSTSSQYITALLMVLPMYKRKLGKGITLLIHSIVTSKPYVTMTLLLLERLGMIVHRYGWKLFSTCIIANRYTGPSFCIEMDISSASYYLILGLVNRSNLKLLSICLYNVQGDFFLVCILKRMGCSILVSRSDVSIYKQARKLLPLRIACHSIPDVSMVLLIVTLITACSISLSGIRSWRLKETDRLLAMTMELRKLGVVVECGIDFISAYSLPTSHLNKDSTININTYGDHRIAMCFAVISSQGVNVRIMNHQCINKTFPSFYYVFNSLAG
ncbi:3-phosphoshikimate 1-carboxyvinyltransferase [Candidatus Tremblaya phenacola]|uniref:3-phosphoshikimate 1-carboxyvinyltransferase n=1 Tax=Candidatus Tremblayella phenacoccinincola TaxID=1010676 RepID=A0A2G0V752_9PROT|nr:3-phosphoshikimate 1-carboxyvinyltransferase [Candidatus Tremblaya phenacola]PHN16305.1 3-phosphoshikimate 1-carboxyvinyltransferase [Candidatus Tremblaya phenacola]